MRFRVASHVAIIFSFLIIWLLTIGSFYLIRAPEQVRASDQSLAKVDAAYYDYLVTEEIRTFEDLRESSPNAQSRWFITSLFALSSIGLTHPLAKPALNFVLLSAMLAWFAIRASQVRAASLSDVLLFVAASSPMLFYATLPSKEMFIALGTLLVGTGLLGGRKRAALALLGLGLVAMGRPVVGALMAACVVVAWRGPKTARAVTCWAVASFVLGLCTMLLIWPGLYVYQELNLEHQGAECSQLGLELCVADSPNVHGLVVVVQRVVLWAVARPLKPLVDLWRADMAPMPLELFEVLLAILNVASGIATLVVIGRLFVGRPRHVAMSNRQRPAFVFLILTAVATTVVVGGALFFQTHRLFAHVSFVLAMAMLIVPRSEARNSK